MADQSQYMSVETLAKFCMITPRRVQALVTEGWMIREPNGKYPTVPCVQGYIRFLKDDNRKGTLNAARNRASDARAREIELRIQKAERTVIPYDEAVASMNFAIGAMRAELEGAAANITRDRELRHRIQDAHDGILKRAVERIARECAALKSGNYAPVASEADDTGDLGEE